MGDDVGKCPDCGAEWLPPMVPVCPSCGLGFDDIEAAAMYFDRLMAKGPVG